MGVNLDASGKNAGLWFSENTRDMWTWARECTRTVMKIA
jgi:hypothetical protein